jgi:hypothetical protein
MEDYAAKMALKTDAALREYVTGYAQYREDAVLAALDELRRRGQPAPEDATLRPQLEAVVQQARATAAAQAATEAEEAELPRLYSPTGIVIMSAMVWVGAGALLLAFNLHQLKRNKALIGLLAFAAVYLIGSNLLLNWLLAQHMLTLSMPFLLNLPLVVAYVWWFWPRYVRTYDFQPRNWLLALGAGILLKFFYASYVLMHDPAARHLIEQQVQQMQRP